MNVPTKHGGDHGSDENVSVADRGANKNTENFCWNSFYSVRGRHQITMSIVSRSSTN